VGKDVWVTQWWADPTATTSRERDQQRDPNPTRDSATPIPGTSTSLGQNSETAKSTQHPPVCSMNDDSSKLQQQPQSVDQPQQQHQVYFPSELFL
jgi:hypothetical protein